MSPNNDNQDYSQHQFAIDCTANNLKYGEKLVLLHIVHKIIHRKPDINFDDLCNEIILVLPAARTLISSFEKKCSFLYIVTSIIKHNYEIPYDSLIHTMRELMKICGVYVDNALSTLHWLMEICYFDCGAFINHIFFPRFIQKIKKIYKSWTCIPINLSQVVKATSFNLPCDASQISKIIFIESPNILFHQLVDKISLYMELDMVHHKKLLGEWRCKNYKKEIDIREIIMMIKKGWDLNPNDVEDLFGNLVSININSTLDEINDAFHKICNKKYYEKHNTYIKNIFRKCYKNLIIKRAGPITDIIKYGVDITKFKNHDVISSVIKMYFTSEILDPLYQICDADTLDMYHQSTPPIVAVYNLIKKHHHISIHAYWSRYKNILIKEYKQCMTSHLVSSPPYTNMPRKYIMATVLNNSTSTVDNIIQYLITIDNIFHEWVDVIHQIYTTFNYAPNIRLEISDYVGINIGKIDTQNLTKCEWRDIAIDAINIYIKNNSFLHQLPRISENAKFIDVFMNVLMNIYEATNFVDDFSIIHIHNINSNFVNSSNKISRYLIRNVISRYGYTFRQTLDLVMEKIPGIDVGEFIKNFRDISKIEFNDLIGVDFDILQKHRITSVIIDEICHGLVLDGDSLHACIKFIENQIPNIYKNIHFINRIIEMYLQRLIIAGKNFMIGELDSTYINRESIMYTHDLIFAITDCICTDSTVNLGDVVKYFTIYIPDLFHNNHYRILNTIINSYMLKKNMLSFQDLDDIGCSMEHIAIDEKIINAVEKNFIECNLNLTLDDITTKIMDKYQSLDTYTKTYRATCIHHQYKSCVVESRYEIYQRELSVIDTNCNYISNVLSIYHVHHVLNRNEIDTIIIKSIVSHILPKYITVDGTPSNLTSVVKSYALKLNCDMSIDENIAIKICVECFDSLIKKYILQTINYASDTSYAVVKSHLMSQMSSTIYNRNIWCILDNYVDILITKLHQKNKNITLGLIFSSISDLPTDTIIVGKFLIIFHYMNLFYKHIITKKSIANLIMEIDRAIAMNVMDVDMAPQQIFYLKKIIDNMQHYHDMYKIPYNYTSIN